MRKTQDVQLHDASGEDCVSCAADCNGQQGGNPGSRFCCGDGGGQNPVPCTDPRCNASGYVCASPCCGDGFCDFGEGSCDCAPDCGTPPGGRVGLPGRRGRRL